MATENTPVANAAPTKEDDDAFRGSYQRFLLPGLLGLKGLAGDGATELDDLVFALVGNYPHIEPTLTEDPEVIQSRSEAISKLLKHFGFADDFVKNVRTSELAANDSLFRALALLKQTVLFYDPYTGSGCEERMKSIVAIVRKAEPAPHPRRPVRANSNDQPA